MNNYDNCQYCGTALTEELRAKYSKDDKIWKCPNCEANVTKTTEEPSGFVGTSDVRLKRQHLYQEIFRVEHYGFLFEEYMQTVFGHKKLTRLTDEELTEFYDFVTALTQIARKIFAEELKRISREKHELYLQKRQIENAENRYIFENLPNKVKESLLGKSAITIRLRVQALLAGELSEEGNKVCHVNIVPFPADEFSLTMLQKAIDSLSENTIAVPHPLTS